MYTYQFVTVACVLLPSTMYVCTPCTVPDIFFDSFGVLFSQFMSHNNFVCCFFFVSWHERHIVSLRSVLVVQWTAFLGGRLNQGTKELCDGSVHLRETKPSLCQTTVWFCSTKNPAFGAGPHVHHTGSFPSLLLFGVRSSTRTLTFP